jgi:cell division protein FtsI (penicillin-binding protein 3)
MYRSEKPINWVSVRIALVAVLFATATVVLVVRAYSLHFSQAESLKHRADKQRTKVLLLEARRGMILDRTGDQLAASLEVDSIYARPRKIADKKLAARKLSGILEMPGNDVLSKLREDKAFVWIKRRVSPFVAERIKRANVEGVFSVKEYKRFYPLKSSAAHTIGFAGIDSRGLEGLELYYDRDLKSEPIPVTAQRDALGRPVMFELVSRNPGRRDMHITLDRNIQYVVERALDEAVKTERARSGVAVVLDADNGEILAMAVRPTYNLNTFHKASAEVRRNRAVADTFEPGSTFKVFLAAAALELGRAASGDIFYCSKGLYRYKGAEIHDVVPHDRLSFDQIIVYSSNIGAVKISERLSKGEFYRFLTRFGFGSPTGVDLPGERSGSLPLPGKWSVLTKATIAFGQGLTVSPLQLTTAFAAAINGGYLYRPHLLMRMTNALGETLTEISPTLVRKVIKKSTSQAVVDILRKVVLTGTGKLARIPGVDVVGKTGTAQKADPAGGYSKDKYVASFVGALMSTKPRVAILVTIDEPQGERRTGGSIAAPVFRKIGEGILALGSSQPSGTQPIFALGRGTRSVARPPGGRCVNVRKGQKPGEWIVPDLKGLDMRRVLEVCGKMKCDPLFKGAGHAVSQDPHPGAVLKEGASLTVTFEGQPS